MGQITRRKFVAGALSAGAALAAGKLLSAPGSSQAAPIDVTPQAYLPLVLGEQTKPRVVHVRDAGATNWSSGAFYNAVSQSTVSAMVQSGLQTLTGKTAWADVWAALFTRIQPSGYMPGQKIAVKVNFNNSGYSDNDCFTHNNYIDALPQPLVGLMAGLVAAGVQASDVVAYDSLRLIPTYFRNPLTAAFPGITFVGGGSACSGVIPASHGKHPSLTVRFTHPTGNLLNRLLADVLYDATYVINVPILKRHEGDSGIPVTLGFKHHLGSLDYIGGSGADDMHLYIRPTDTGTYSSSYNPLVDIYCNPNIGSKTVLTVGDGLFGSPYGHLAIVPKSWPTFGDAPNSLFFATDPVAIDCVMTDFLHAEGQPATLHAYDVLYCAAEAGLGVCEGTREAPGGDPWQTPYGSGYTDLRYVRLDL